MKIAAEEQRKEMLRDCVASRKPAIAVLFDARLALNAPVIMWLDDRDPS